MRERDLHFKRGHLANKDTQPTVQKKDESETDGYRKGKQIAKEILAKKEAELGRELSFEEKLELFKKVKGEILGQFKDSIKNFLDPEKDK